MRRTTAFLAALALAAPLVVTGVLASGTPAGATGTVTVTPNTNLAGGTLVTVNWTGLSPNGSPSIFQCKSAPTTGASGADCEFLTLQVASDNSNASGAGSDTFVVRDTAGLQALNSHTSIACDVAHPGAVVVVDNPEDLNSGSSQTITCQDPVPTAPVSHQLLSCGGISGIGTFSPAMGSNSAKYVKGAVSESKGDKHLFGSNALIAADSTTCAVDPSIATNNPATDSLAGTTPKPNPFDDQTGGATTLTSTGTTAKTVLTLAGSATCQTEPQGTVNGGFPTAYALQGKLIMKFDQLVGGKPLQTQAYVHLTKDPSDPDPTHWKLDGSVALGVGIGGDLTGTVKIAPTTHVKNLNPNECSDADVTDDSLNATIAEVAVTLADGADQNSTVDPITVTVLG